MSAFLKIDRCRKCDQELPWEWVPPVTLGAKQLAGTGVWRSSLVDGLCPRCFESVETNRRHTARTYTRKEELIRLLGGAKPFREFTFERYQVTSDNQAGLETARSFDPGKRNLYLWGPCGVGKTHLSFAIARRNFWEGRSVAVATPAQLIRKLRMKPPEEEQQAIDAFVRAEVLVLDDLGIGADTPYSKQILQETLDSRDYKDRYGLVVTSKYSLSRLASRMGDETIASRLAGMCHVVEIKGVDRRRRG
jgi:DNA replication protein DnaC